MVPGPSFLDFLRKSAGSLQDLGPLLIAVLNEQGGIESYAALNLYLGSLAMLISDLSNMLGLSSVNTVLVTYLIGSTLAEDL